MLCKFESRCSRLAVAQLLVIGQLLATQGTGGHWRDLPTLIIRPLALPDPRQSRELTMSICDQGSMSSASPPGSVFQHAADDAIDDDDRIVEIC